MTSSPSYPRLAARTRNFTLGRPRDFTISPDGERLIFLRSGSGTDPVQRLWLKQLDTGEERCLVDPADLDAPDEDSLPPEERARRERAREQAGGIVRYATDRDVRRAVFAIGSQAWLTDVTDVNDVDTATPQRLAVEGPVIDPRLDPDGARVAWVSGGTLRVTTLSDDATRTLAGDDDDNVTWGLADFVAAEEMGRTRGFWWSPDGTQLLVARVDTSGVARWWISNPVDPAAAPQPVAYPSAGTANADVTLHLVGTDGSRRDVLWDRDALPYLAAVHWADSGPPLVTVQSRDQRRLTHLAVDPVTARTTIVADATGEPWIDLTPGVPRWHGDHLITVTDDVASDVRRLARGGAPVTPPDLHLREVIAVDGDSAVVTGSRGDPTAIGVWRVGLDLDPPDSDPPDSDALGTLEPLTDDTGVATAVAAGSVTLIQRATVEEPTATAVMSGGRRMPVADVSTPSPVQPQTVRLQLGPRRLEAALLRPAGIPPDEPLPVLMDPYGGPHAQRVLQNVAAFRTSQWFADQGFAVLVVDGRGTPGRGLAWEHAVHRDLATHVLEDQVVALHAAADHTALDLERVAIRGWSFGGYLAALAVLRRPDVFAAAIAGAPVTDMRLYDTHYTERYLGHPAESPQVYDDNSLLPIADRLERPLLIIHGLADDNVVVAHTLRLSQALLEAGRPHQVLPLSGVTHMTPQEVVAENLMLLQARFLRDALGLAG